MNLTTLAQNGLGVPQVASYVLHIGIGAFFACSGYNKLTNPGRHKVFLETLEADHVPFPRVNEWWVPSWELIGGFSLAAGIMPAFAAAILLIIIFVATLAEGKKRVAAYSPINKADCLADWLYLPEVLYGLILASIVMGV